MPSGFVQYSPRRPAERAEIAAVEADGLKRRAGGDGMANAFDGVVGVHQQRTGFGKQFAKAAEGDDFIVVGHDPRMRLSAERRYAKDPARLGIAGADATSKIS